MALARRRTVAVLATACLAGCATLDQPTFAREIAAVAQDGTPASQARAALVDKGFACTPVRDADPRQECTRMTQHVLPPVTCVESVTFGIDAATAQVRELAPRIACTGL